jgi:hypothetical protein
MVAVCTMFLGSLYISLRGRLSPKSFADGFWRLAFIGATVNSFTWTRSAIGYPFNHWATLASGVAAARPLFALSLAVLQQPTDRQTPLIGNHPR